MLTHSWRLYFLTCLFCLNYLRMDWKCISITGYHGNTQILQFYSTVSSAMSVHTKRSVAISTEYIHLQTEFYLEKSLEHQVFLLAESVCRMQVTCNTPFVLDLKGKSTCTHYSLMKFLRRLINKWFLILPYTNMCIALHTRCFTSVCW